METDVHAGCGYPGSEHSVISGGFDIGRGWVIRCCHEPRPDTEGKQDG